MGKGFKIGHQTEVRELEGEFSADLQFYDANALEEGRGRCKL